MERALKSDLAMNLHRPIRPKRWKNTKIIETVNSRYPAKPLLSNELTPSPAIDSLNPKDKKIFSIIELLKISRIDKNEDS